MIKKLCLSCFSLLFVISVYSDSSALSLVGSASVVFTDAAAGIGTVTYGFTFLPPPPFPASPVFDIISFSLFRTPADFTSYTITGSSLPGGTGAFTDTGSELKAVPLTAVSGTSFTITVAFDLVGPADLVPLSQSFGGSFFLRDAGEPAFKFPDDLGALESVGGSFAATPEPASLILLGSGLLGLGAVSRFRQRWSKSRKS